MKNNNTLTVKSLRDNKNKVKVYHERLVGPSPRELSQLKKPTFAHIKKGEAHNLQKIVLTVSPVVFSKGGRTTVKVTSKAGNDYEAVALTSKKDCFNRRRGIIIALARIERQAAQNGETLV